MKKALSLFIALIIIISVFPLSAFAYAGTDLRIGNQGVYPGRTFLRPYPYFTGYNENTLYLNNNVITKGDTIYGSNSGIHYTDGNTLYICVSGNNVISATDIGVGINSTASKIHIYGNGTLTIDANNTAIKADDIYISDITLTIEGEDGIVCENGTVTLDNVTFTADCDGAAIKANNVSVNGGSLKLAGYSGIVCEKGTVALENVDFEADCAETAIEAENVYFDNSESDNKSIIIKAKKGIEADTVEINDYNVEFQTGTDVGINADAITINDSELTSEANTTINSTNAVFVNGSSLELAGNSEIVWEGDVTLENVNFEADCTETAIKAETVTIDCSKVNSDATNTIKATENVEITNSLFRAGGENAVIAKNVAITDCVDDPVADEEGKSAVCIGASKNGIVADKVTIDSSDVEFVNGYICISATDVEINNCPEIIFESATDVGIKAEEVNFSECYFVVISSKTGINATTVNMNQTPFFINGNEGIIADNVTIENCECIEDDDITQFEYLYIHTKNTAIRADDITFQNNEYGDIVSDENSALVASNITVDGGKLKVETTSATDAIKVEKDFKVKNKAEVIIVSKDGAINNAANLDEYDDCLIDYKDSDELKLYKEKEEVAENYNESKYVRIYSGENIYGIVFPKDNTTPTDYPNLQDAFEAARDGDVVVVRKDGSAEVSGNKTIDVIFKNNAKANISAASGYGMVILDRKDNHIIYRFYELPEHRFLPGHDYNTSKTTESTTPVKEEETNPNTGAGVAPMVLMLAAIIPACIIGKKHF